MKDLSECLKAAKRKAETCKEGNDPDITGLCSSIIDSETALMMESLKKSDSLLMRCPVFVVIEVRVDEMSRREPMQSSAVSRMSP